MLNKRWKAALQALIDLVGPERVREIEIERGLFWGGRIRVVGGTPQAEQTESPSPAASRATADGRPDEAASTEAAEGADGLHTVSSPLVGLFYRAPAPDAPPHVQEGDTVGPGQTLCVIETMKIMNDIESDIAGRVAQILVENGRPVEYNTPLFLIEPL